MIRWSPRVILLSWLCVASAYVSAATLTTPAVPQSSLRQTYDVATIKPCEPEENPTGARGTAGGTNATFSPGRFYVPCVTVEQLIYLAYASYGAPDTDRLANDNAGSASNATKVRGGPDWVHSLKVKYSIEATASGATERTVLMGSMLRSLLEDRFKLKLRREVEEKPMFDLVVAKSGLKLKPMKDGDCVPFDPKTSDPRSGNNCGGIMSSGRGPNALWTFNGFKLSALANRLSSTVGLHVADKTGIDSEFIMRLEFHPDENTPGIIWNAARDADTSVPRASSLFNALEEQLGLTLEKTRGPHGYLVIDHIERPTPDGPASVAPARSQGPGVRLASWQTAVTGAQRFEVASIKPCEPNAPTGRVTVSPAGLNITCMRLDNIIDIAHVVNGSEPLLNRQPLPLSLDADRVRGGPAWVHSDADKFTIETRTGVAVDSRTKQGAMLQALLEERFGVKVHRGTEDVPMYALTVAKDGFKMQPNGPNACEKFDAATSGGRGMTPRGDGEKPWCGLTGGTNGTNRVYNAGGVSMAIFAKNGLSSAMDRYVLDRTGVSGEFNFRIEYAYDETAPDRMAQFANRPPATNADAPRGPSILAALDKLGLKIENIKGPTQFIVIDQAQKPKPDLVVSNGLIASRR